MKVKDLVQECKNRPTRIDCNKCPYKIECQRLRYYLTDIDPCKLEKLFEKDV